MLTVRDEVIGRREAAPAFLSTGRPLVAGVVKASADARMARATSVVLSISILELTFRELLCV